MPLFKFTLTVLVAVMFRFQSSLAFAFQSTMQQVRISLRRQDRNVLPYQCYNLRRKSHVSASSTVKDDASVEEETINWLRRVVIGLNLCPFAERPLRQDKVLIDVVRGNDDEEILSRVFDHLLSRTTEPGTTLVVCPECHPDDFHSYLDMLELIETGIIKDDSTFEGVIQVAPFHPLFQFEGSEPDSADNWTNRSPFPLFHILREDEVTLAVDRLDGDAGKVWRRNAGLIQAMEKDFGSNGLQDIMRGETGASEMQTQLRELLKCHRIDLSNNKGE